MAEIKVVVMYGPEKQVQKWHLATAGLPTDSAGVRCELHTTKIAR